MLLQDKVAVVYGGAGSIGSALARAFAGEGATVHLTGRDQAAVDVVAEKIRRGGLTAEAAQVDALDEQAVDEHLGTSSTPRAASTSRSTPSASPTADILGLPLVELDAAQFALPLADVHDVVLPHGPARGPADDPRTGRG